MQTRPRGLVRSESLFHQKLTKQDREELLKLQTLRELPKSRYATQSCITGIPSRRGRRAVYSHVEVYKMVEDIATTLREAGVRPQTVCTFILDSSIEAIVYFLALQWIGAIAVPMDPSLSKEEIIQILKQVNAHTVVSALVDEDEQDDDELFNKIEDCCKTQNIIHWYISRSTNRGVFLEMKGIRAGEGAAWSGGAGDFKYDSREPCIRLASAYGDKCLAIELSHRAVALATRQFSNTYSLTAEYSTLLVAPFYSIHGLMCVLASMYSGGNVVIVDGNIQDVDTLLKNIKDNKIDWLSIDPDTIMEMHKKVSEDASLLDGVTLSFIRSVGGNIHEESLKGVEEVLHAPILAAYGTTETCGLVTANKEFDFRPETCGKPITGCEVSIFDAESKHVQSTNTVGQIGVYGGHITTGYISNEYANNACFIEVERDNVPVRFFLTGDDGLLTDEGFLKVTTYKEYRTRAADLAKEEEIYIEKKRTQQLQAVLAQTESEKTSEPNSTTHTDDHESTEPDKILTPQESFYVDNYSKKDSATATYSDRTRSHDISTDLPIEGSDSDSSYSTGDSEGPIVTDSTNIPDSITNQEASVSTVIAPSTTTATQAAVSAAIDDELLKRMLERLDQIERNQTRLEEEIEARHRMEMARMRELIERLHDSKLPPPPAPTINMDVINSAVNKAAASAQSSSRDTAAAAKAAQEAALSAAEAQKKMESSMVEVVDPDKINKTVMVSLDEVEEAVKLHPAVENARAFGRPDKRYGMEVFCAVMPKTGARISEPWLMLHAQSVLPAAFVPKRFFYKDGLKGNEERSRLAGDKELKRVSEIAGYSKTKIVKSPAWTPQNVA